MKSVLLSSVFFVAFAFFNANRVQAQEAWEAPAKNQSMANPVASNAESIAAGKAVWTKHCQSCHGKTGHGDGSKAAQLKTEPGDFSTAKFQKQSDGSIFYKTITGRDDMPSFKKKIPDQEDIWSVINYIRTFKK